MSPSWFRSAVDTNGPAAGKVQLVASEPYLDQLAAAGYGAELARDEFLPLSGKQ